LKNVSKLDIFLHIVLKVAGTIFLLEAKMLTLVCRNITLYLELGSSH